MAASMESAAAITGWKRDGAFPGRALREPPLAFRLADSVGGRSALLTQVVEREIIPRLTLAHGAAPAVETPRSLDFDTDKVREFAGIVLARDAAAACSYVEELRVRGATLEVLYLKLLAPAARWLGELWEEDRADFTEVTIGLLRLMQVLHEVGPAFRDEAGTDANGRRALLVPAPGDQHSLGLAMVSDFFRRAGWAVWDMPTASGGDLARLVRREWFAVVGFSVSCERWLDAARSAIRAIRGASCNAEIGVMVGGPLFLEHPELVAGVGADATASDAQHAVLQAQGLLTKLGERGR
jgi:methanogenic corrinoid protein MtbC1